MTILERIVETKKSEAARLAPRAAELRAAAEAMPAPRRFRDALRRPAEVALIAEVKRRSPSAGLIRPDADPLAIAHDYERGGAAALSVLTDAEYFGGSLDDLGVVRDAVGLPILRKDFTIDALQIWEARASGADAILLIVRILDEHRLRDLLDLTRQLGMDALVEVHTAGELEEALAAGADLIGLNNRDLSSFRTDLGLTEDLVGGVSEGVVVVAESGIRGAEDVARLGAVGVDAILVGETLMRAADPGAAARSLVGHRKNPRSMAAPEKRGLAAPAAP